MHAARRFCRKMKTTRILNETVCFLSEGHRLPTKPPRTTLRRWALEGCRTPDGVVTLEYCYRGRSPITSVEAFDRFLARVNGEEVPTTDAGQTG